jgi:hypothetical protein
VTLRWALAALLGALALVGCGSDEPAAEEPGGETGKQVRLWTSCTNERSGYEIRYPKEWHTATLDGEFECSFFDPEPFEIIEGSEFPLTALQAFPAGEEGRTFDQVVGEYVDPMFERELARSDATVAGFSAVRLETEATGRGLFDEGTRTLAYIVDRDVAPFVVKAQAFPGAELHEDVLEQSAQTIRFFEPTGDDGWTSYMPLDIPAPVMVTHAAILEAATAQDYDALAALVPETGFTYTFGGPVPGGPAAYWREIEAEEDPLGKLAAILKMPPTIVDHTYIWPFAYDRDPAGLTADEREILSAAATEAEIDQWAEFGHYLGWRAGINARGEWVFFVAGD